MKTVTTIFAAALLATTSGAALAATPDARIQSLEDQIQSLAKELQSLKSDAAKQQQAADARQAMVEKRQADTEAAYKKQQSTSAKASITNGRLSVASTDGNFTASVRALLQVDSGYYMQQGSAASLPSANGPDLSSGTNLRRVFLGLQGKVFADWNYYFLYDFGGASVETPGHILYAYMQYSGLAPWSFRVGAFPAPINIEDSTASADLLFFERNSPSNLQRNIAGSEGRDGISVFYTGERIFGALSLTGNKIGDGAKALAAAGTTAVPTYDDQNALSGRFTVIPVSTEDAHWIVGVNGLTVFNLPERVPHGSTSLATVPGGTAAGSYTFADLPEFSVDSNAIQLVNTGALSASHVTSWGLETAANYESLYGQAGYYGYQIHRSPTAYNVYSAPSSYAATAVQPSNNSFSGWYVQASWVLTGESHGYSPATAAFTAPQPAQPFSLKDGTWGAFEFAARVSDLNLNSHANDASAVITNWTATTTSYTYYNTVRGGDQKILTLGMNWYPNTAIRFAVDYQYIDVKRLQTPAATTAATLPAVNVGQKLSTVAMRFQLAL